MTDEMCESRSFKGERVRAASARTESDHQADIGRCARRAITIRAAAAPHPNPLPFAEERRGEGDVNFSAWPSPVLQPALVHVTTVRIAVIYQRLHFRYTISKSCITPCVMSDALRC